jgi:hypothetical protein
MADTTTLDEIKGIPDDKWRDFSKLGVLKRI